MAHLKIIFVVLFYYFSISSGSPSVRFPQEADPRPWKNQNAVLNVGESISQLSEDVVPTHYKLFVRVILDNNPGNFTAPGNVTITVEAKQATNQITLNARDLDIEWETITVTNVATGAQIAVSSTSEDTSEFTFTLSLAQPLVATQNYRIFVRFVGLIPISPLNGLYRSSYIHPETNEIRYLAATQFERSSARKVFPCFDEPGFRSIFEVSIGRTQDKHSLTNMEITSTQTDPENPGFEWDHYGPTVSMPTYLLAIVVSDFNSEAAAPELMRGRLSKVWANSRTMTPGSGIYAAETSAKVITYFEQLYNTTYDLPKLDSGAIPDFSAGAMENWGLVLYRENLLIHYNGTSTESARRSISSVISHELAHQWFGNIVTCAWWSDIWLNEGFATYVSYLGVHATDPEYDALVWIQDDSYQSAMAYDVGVNSQPVSNDGTNPNAIIYDKGGAIIRMMEGFLSEATLIKGLEKYLHRHSYGNAITDDLWVALQEQAIEDGTLGPDLTVKDIMDTFVHQSGVPLVRVVMENETTIRFSQESYGPNPRKVNTTVLNPAELWNIPISYHRAQDPDFGGQNQLPKLWIPKDVPLLYHQVDTTEWILVNTASTGYFRVLYCAFFRNRLDEQLAADHKLISPNSRSQLIDDYFHLAFSDPSYETVANAMFVTKYLAKEDRLTPWVTLFNNLGVAFDYFSGSRTYYSHFKDYFGERINGSLHLIGVEQGAQGNPGNPAILRNRLLQWGCAFGLPACYEYANKLRLEWVNNPNVNPIPADLRTTMYCAIVAAGGDAAYNFVLGKFFEDPTAWRNALGCATDPDTIDQILELSLNSQSGISKGDAAGLLERIAMTSGGRPKLLEFLEGRIADIVSYHDTAAIAQAIASLSNYLSDPEDYTAVNNYYQANFQEYLWEQQVSITNSLGKINRNVNWMTHYGQEMVAFFELQKKH